MGVTLDLAHEIEKLRACPKGVCRHIDMVQSSMKAPLHGSFCIRKNGGWELAAIPCKDLEYGKMMHSDIHSIGLILIE